MANIRLPNLFDEIYGDFQSIVCENGERARRGKRGGAKTFVKLLPIITDIIALRAPC